MRQEDVVVSYFVHLAKSQSLRNGNKRMSIMFTSVFLYLHGFELTIPFDRLKELALMVVKDKQTPIDEIKEQIAEIFKGKMSQGKFEE